MKLKKLSEQVVIVQGASSGIGRISARMLAEHGAKLVVSARGKEGLVSLVEEIRTAGGTAEYFVADVIDFEQIKALGKFTEDTYGKIDTWVSTAGSWVTATFEDHTVEEFQRVIDVNLMGMAKTLWAALPHLKGNLADGADGASIILVSSMLGQMAIPLSSSYNASKFGMQGMMNALRIELMQENIPINLVNIMPYGTNTPIYNTGLSKIGKVPKPAPPIVQPEEVGKLIVYAAENPARDLWGSIEAFLMDKAYQVVPDLVDQVLAVNSSKEKQSSEKDRTWDEPNNLFAIVDDYREEGDYSGESVVDDPLVAYQTGQGDGHALKERIDKQAEETIEYLKSFLPRDKDIANDKQRDFTLDAVEAMKVLSKSKVPV